MPGNPYDQFEAQAPSTKAAGNPYDRFDAYDPRKESVSRGTLAPSEPVRGAGEAALSMLTSGTTGLLGRAGGALGGFAGAIGSGQFGTPEGAQRIAQASQEGGERLTYSPRRQTGQEYLGNVANVMDRSKLAGLGPNEAMMLGGIPKPPPMAGPMASSAKAAITPKIEPQTAQLAQRAKAMGIEIPPDKLTDNKFLRLIGEASRQVPLSGAKDAANAEAFNKAIIRTFGGDEGAWKISPQVYAQAMNKHGAAIGDISAKNPVPYQALKSQLDEMVANAQNFETADVSKIVTNYANEMKALGEAQGVIDGTAMRKLRTKLTGQMRRTANGDLKHALSELDDAMLDAIQGQLGPEELAAFNEARRFYANGKTVEPLIAKAAVKGKGDMSPAALAGAVTSTGSKKGAVAKGRGGELADIAAVGSRFLTEPGSSNTAERSLAYGALGGGGFAGGIPAAAGIYGAANLYNRLGPRLTQRMLPPPP